MTKRSDLPDELPENWRWASFGDVAEYVNGYGFSKSEWENEGRPIIRIQNLTGTGDSFNYYSGEIDEKYIVTPGTLLISWSATLGAYIWRGEEALLNQHIYKVKPHDHVSKKYLYYVADFSDDELMRRAHGSGMKHVTKDVFESFPIPLPPLPEQRRIVAKIEELFSNLDAGMDDLQTAGQQLERYRLSVLQAAVEGRLTADWRRTHDPEPADQLLERIGEERRAEWEERYRWNRYESKGKEPPSGWKSRYKTPEQPESSEKELPSTWSWTTVQQVSFVGTGATPKRGNPDFWDGGDIPWVTSGALNAQYVEEAEECITEEALEETSCEIFPKHSLLIAMYGEGKTRGKVAELMIEAATNQACAAVEVVGDKPAVREYLKVYFQKNYQDIRRQAAGGVQPNLNLGIIRGINFPFPPLAEQKQIVDEVERLLSVADDAATTAEREHTRAERLRQSILKQAFSGQLVPHEEGASPPSIDGTASEESDTGSSKDVDSDVEDLMGSADPSKQIEMDL